MLWLDGEGKSRAGLDVRQWSVYLDGVEWSGVVG